jgi:predicted DNA-binding protein
MITGETASVQVVVRVPENLRKRVHAVAALRGERMADVVRLALEKYVDDALADAEDARAARAIRARIDQGERTYFHEDIWVEIEALEAQGALPA